MEENTLEYMLALRFENEVDGKEKTKGIHK
jgi:hypothetical protein